ncbi:MAG: S-layer homology domain-containing protein, partial [Clostridia bacterium]|nr:S-layer homology domain-containing protein [Clostridia bacterium]
GKQDSETVSEDAKFDNDEMVLINLGLKETIKDATKITFVYECEDLADFEDISVEKIGKNSVEMIQNENQFKIEFTNFGEVKDFGVLKFSADSGDYVLNERCEIVYDVSGYPMDAIGKSEDKTIEITVREPKKQSGGSGGGGGAISSSGDGFSSSMGNHIANDEEDNNQETKLGFKDLNEASWAEEYVNSLYENGIVSMPDDGKFRPNDNVTREEFLKMLVMAFDLYDETATTNLADVEKGSWYYPYVASGQKYGIVLGNEQNCFDVGKQITREDMSVMIARILAEFGYQAEETEAFVDESEIASYAKDAAGELFASGIMSGDENKNFMPKSFTTRAQAAKVIFEALKLCK